MAAFVLGNGISRREIDVDQLLELGDVYGCNALYRTHRPTVLVATDRAIAEEIQRSGYPLTNRFYTRKPIDGSGAQKIPERYYGFSSGPVAMAMAAMEGAYRIYLVGFDMGPAPNGRFNNVYADTQFYKSVANEPTFVGNWVRQVRTIARDHASCEFFRVFGPTTAEIPELADLRNLSRLDMTDFVARINKPKDL